MTKALAKTLFYRHTDTIMGRRVPQSIVLLKNGENQETTKTKQNEEGRCSEV
jgi:hypothetical protein